MKTTINRFDLYRFERMVSKLVKPSELPTNVLFARCEDGLQISAFCNGAVLTYTLPSRTESDPFTLPWGTLKELVAKKYDTIDFVVQGRELTLHWYENGIPQTKSEQSFGSGDRRIPAKPEKTATHSFDLFDALLDASKCVDDGNVRYALGAVCLRGATNQVISTDGRQALIQDDFDFTFDNDVLCPVSKIFASRELRDLGENVKIGVKDDWVYFNVGGVNFWLQKVEGKYPLMDQFIKNIDDHTWLNVDPDDAIFVSERIEALPGKDKVHDPVYINLDKNTIAVRGHDNATHTATELRLENSCYTGSHLSLGINRKFLKNALSFGIVRLGFDTKDAKDIVPIVGFGDKKTFIAMPLETKEPNVEPGKLTVLSSNTKASVSPKIEKPVRTEKLIPTSRPSRNVKPQAKPKGKVTVLEDAMKLRLSLRTTLTDVNSLIQSIKSQRRHDKLLRDTVNSLRKLQNV